MKLIADSGSTKTSWITVEGSHIGKVVETSGINPVRDKEEVISKVIAQVQEGLQGSISQVYFYGAGCIPPYSTTVKHVLQEYFPQAKIQVESDMMGAAIALCGHQEGIACILGTGANSCLFDGQKIVRQTPALGYILGDEGSGACLGKRLVGDVFKRQLPPSLLQAFDDELGLTQTEVIDRVYRQPQANLFLSSLVPFLARHIDHEAIQQLVTDEFRRFIRRNILNYQRPDLPVCFVGGIVNSFAPQLKVAIEQEGLKMGKAIQKPIQAMASYHAQIN